MFDLMAECEVKVWGDWKHLTLDQALELDPSHLAERLVRESALRHVLNRADILI
jgi:hypothetical protein